MFSRRSIFKSCLGGALALTFTSTALAHDAPRVETEVSLVDGTALEITHVLQLSAAQRLLHIGGVIETNDLSGLRARAQAALYASERFEIQADGNPLALTLLGAEIEGGHVYIYQTGEIETLPKVWSVRNSILRDLNARFDNTVNLPTPDGIQTLVFDGADLEAVKSTS